METLDGIAAAYAKLRRLEEKRIELACRNRNLTGSQAPRRRALERDIASSMQSLRLAAWIEDWIPRRISCASWKRRRR